MPTIRTAKVNITTNDDERRIDLDILEERREQAAIREEKAKLKMAYVRRFQELATLCLTMVLDSEKMMEVFTGGLPRSIEGNVTASKPQTLEEAINIA
ncbi:hypothetical protein Tco_1567858 [Tanacetum coccineum]